MGNKRDIQCSDHVSEHLTMYDAEAKKRKALKEGYEAAGDKSAAKKAREATVLYCTGCQGWF